MLLLLALARTHWCHFGIRPGEIYTLDAGMRMGKSELWKEVMVYRGTMLSMGFRLPCNRLSLQINTYP